MTNVPSDEDFERAKRLDREDSRGLEQVSENVTRRFKDRCPLHAFCILSQRDVDFRAYVFGDGPLAADFGEGRRLLRHAFYHATSSPRCTSLSST